MPDDRGFGRRADGLTGRRTAQRERVSLPVSLQTVDQSRVALLADISQTGCRLHGIGLPRVGQDVLLQAADVELFGRVVWKAGEERGVEFENAMSRSDLAHLREALARQSGQDSSDPDIIPPEGRRGV